MASTVEIVVYGKPQPAGSKRAFVRGGHARVVDANKNAAPWKEAVGRAAVEAHDGPLLTGALEVELNFYAPRPKGHYGSGTKSGVVRDSAPQHPIVKPDIDKLSRAIMDGLTKTLWRDDAQVVSKTAVKRYGEPARCEVRVTVCGAQTVGEARYPQQSLIAA